MPFTDGTTFREITPDGYVEGSFMLLKDGRYYFMWSEGGCYSFLSTVAGSTWEARRAGM